MLTPKQEAFAQAIADGLSQADAYRKAFDVKPTTKPETVQKRASELMSDGEVRLRVKSLRKAAIECWLAAKAGKLTDELISQQASLCVEDAETDDAKSSPGVITKSVRYSVFMRAGFKCQCCGAKPSPFNGVTLHIDHIIPKSLGGTNDEVNLQSLCADCNSSKSNNFAYDHNRELNLWQT